MNYIILNGKKSTMVKGLMIQSLPPISKPLMRTRIEEIDGRDGDIVTKLGYSAYDRELSIGLFGDFDMSEVAQFFDSEGEAIFSNELDKKYKYQILDQINYERLGRFKQAVIKFHVQPFKYPTTDDTFKAILDLSPSYFEVFNYGNIYSRPILKLRKSEGFGHNFTLTFGQRLSNYRVVGNSIQILSGTYTEIEIDFENMNATHPNDVHETPANRKISGNLLNMKLESGLNYIGIEDISMVVATINNVTRWI